MAMWSLVVVSSSELVEKFLRGFFLDSDCKILEDITVRYQIESICIVRRVDRKFSRLLIRYALLKMLSKIKAKNILEDLSYSCVFTTTVNFYKDSDASFNHQNNELTTKFVDRTWLVCNSMFWWLKLAIESS